MCLLFIFTGILGRDVDKLQLDVPRRDRVADSGMDANGVGGDDSNDEVHRWLLRFPVRRGHCLKSEIQRRAGRSSTPAVSLSAADEENSMTANFVHAA